MRLSRVAAVVCLVGLQSIIFEGLSACSSSPSATVASATAASQPQATSLFGISSSKNIIASFSAQTGASSGGITPPSGFTITTVATDSVGQIYVGGYTSSAEEVLVYSNTAVGATAPSPTPLRTIGIAGVVASSAAAAAPTALAVDASGTIYCVLATSANVEVLPANSSGLTTPTTINISGLTSAGYLATDTSGQLYVSGQNASGGVIDVFAASSSGLVTPSRSIALSGTGSSAIALDSAGNIYASIVSSNTQQVEQFSSSGTATVSFTAPLPTGASLAAIGAVHLDKGGNVYVMSLTDSATGGKSVEIYGYAPSAKTPFLSVPAASADTPVFALF